MTPEQIDGITKARMLANIARAGTSEPQFADNGAYAAFVCAAASLSELPESVADDYARQTAHLSIDELGKQLAEKLTYTLPPPAPEPQPIVEPDAGPYKAMTPAAFAEKLAPHMAGLWAAATQSAEVATWFATAFTTSVITRDAAYPAMRKLEAAGVLPAGTADKVWP